VSDESPDNTGQPPAAPERAAPYNDSGDWTGCRCPKCTYTTLVDAAAGEVVPAFCGICGYQLKPTKVLDVRNRTPEDFENAVKTSREENTKRGDLSVQSSTDIDRSEGGDDE
jgi:hypothetical protein